MGSKSGLLGAILNPVGYLTGKVAGKVFDDKMAGIISGSLSGYGAAKWRSPPCTSLQKR